MIIYNKDSSVVYPLSRNYGKLIIVHLKPIVVKCMDNETNNTGLPVTDDKPMFIPRHNGKAYHFCFARLFWRCFISVHIA